MFTLIILYLWLKEFTEPVRPWLHGNTNSCESSHSVLPKERDDFTPIKKYNTRVYSYYYSFKRDNPGKLYLGKNPDVSKKLINDLLQDSNVTYLEKQFRIRDIEVNAIYNDLYN